MISRWKKKPKKPSFSRVLSLKLLIFDPKVENFYHQIIKTRFLQRRYKLNRTREFDKCFLISIQVNLALS